MFGTWTFPLGVICLLQLSVSAEPRPDFSLHESLSGTSSVSSALSETSGTVAEIDNNLSYMVTSGYDGLAELLDLCQEVGETVTNLLQQVLVPLVTLAPSSSSQDEDQFGTAAEAIAAVEEFFSNRLVEIVSDIGDLTGAALPGQLGDMFSRISLGLGHLSETLGRLLEAVQEVHSHHSSEESSEGCSRTYVQPRLVYEVVYAVRNLRAYLPVVTYVLTTTVQNIMTADAFIVRLSERATEVQEPSQYVDLIDASTTGLAVAVSNAVQGLQSTLFAVGTAVSGLSNIQMTMAYGALQQVFSNLNTVLSGSQSGFQNALADIGTMLQTVLSPDMSTPSVDNTEVVHQLVFTLIGGGPYARYCFYKYSELLFGLANTGLTGVETCVNREIIRLQDLRAAMLMHVQMLAFDLADIVQQVTVCSRLPSPSSREACLSMLVTNYTDLASNFQLKFNNLFTTGVLEAVASKFRLKSCVQLLQFEIVDGTASTLTDMIRQCEINGPVSETH